MPEYQKPPAFLSKFVNPMLVSAITRLGIRPGGMAVLQVVGRKTGKEIRIPLNPVEVGGKAYLLSPRGEMQWVQNVRAANGTAALHFGRKKQPVVLTEVHGDERIQILREYLKRFGSLIKGVKNLDDLSKDSSDEQLKQVVDRFPVFLVEKS